MQRNHHEKTLPGVLDAINNFIADPDNWEAENSVIDEVERWGKRTGNQGALEIVDGFCDDPERRPREYGIKGVEFLREVYNLADGRFDAGE